MKVSTTAPLLVVEVIVLAITFGLQAWALHILAVSCQYARDAIFNAESNVPSALAFTSNQTDTAVGYAVTSVVPATTSVRMSTYTEILIDGKTFVTTQSEAFTITPQLVGYSPTATSTRTRLTTGLGDVRAGAGPHDIYVKTDAARATPVVRRARAGSTIDQFNAWSLVTAYDLNSFRTLTVNHGFGKHFVEAGLDYDYFDERNGGYSRSDYARIAGLTTLMACAMAAVLTRLYFNVDAIFKRNTKGVEAARPRWKLYVNVIATVLLCATCIAFWTIYGLWTHRSEAIDEAYRAFSKDRQMIYLRIDSLFDTKPWQGVAIALITFWCLSCVTSIVRCIAELSSKARSTV